MSPSRLTRARILPMISMAEDEVMLPRIEITPDALKAELARLEQEHCMSSIEFYARFHEGTIPEGRDFMRWAWLCTVAMRQGMLSFTPAHA